MDKVSIIVPIYNVEKYLERCIKSILSQTYTNIEVLLVNDGSKDQSEAICTKYESIDSRINYYKKVNGGLSSARNYGIERATGNYYLFIDSDDYIDKTMVETLIKAARQYNADIVECNYYEVINGKVHIFKHSKNKVYSSKEAISSLIYNDGITPTAWNKLYSNRVFSTLRYSEGIYHEDEEIIIKLLSKANKIVEIGQPLYFYIKRDGSIINSKFNIKHLDIIKIMEDRINFLMKMEFDLDIVELAESRLSNIYNEMYGKLCASDDTTFVNKKSELNNKRKMQIKKVMSSTISKKKKVKSLFFYLFPRLTNIILNKG